MIAAFGSHRWSARGRGMPLDRLTERVGSTPYFAYDRRLFSERVECCAQHYRRFALSYAVKANPMPAVVQHLAGLVDALDVASDARDADRTRYPDAAQSGSVSPGRGKPRRRWQAVAAGVTIEMESATEAQRVSKPARCSVCAPGSPCGSIPTSR